jgi:hypothetical protein
MFSAAELSNALVRCFNADLWLTLQKSNFGSALQNASTAFFDAAKIMYLTLHKHHTVTAELSASFDLANAARTIVFELVMQLSFLENKFLRKCLVI